MRLSFPKCLIGETLLVEGMCILHLLPREVPIHMAVWPHDYFTATVSHLIRSRRIFPFLGTEGVQHYLNHRAFS